MAAKRLAAMFENKEAEAKQYNARNTVQNSAASKPVIHKEKTPQNGTVSNSPYFQRMMSQQQKKQQQEAKLQPQHESTSKPSNTTNSTSPPSSNGNKPNTSTSNNSTTNNTNNKNGTELNTISFNNGNSINSRILMFSNPNHGLPTAQGISKKDTAPKTNASAGLL